MSLFVSELITLKYEFKLSIFVSLLKIQASKHFNLFISWILRFWYLYPLDKLISLYHYFIGLDVELVFNLSLNPANFLVKVQDTDLKIFWWIFDFLLNKQPWSHLDAKMWKDFSKLKIRKFFHPNRWRSFYQRA
jgi:hypothetical protein